MTHFTKHVSNSSKADRLLACYICYNSIVYVLSLFWYSSKEILAVLCPVICETNEWRMGAYDNRLRRDVSRVLYVFTRTQRA